MIKTICTIMLSAVCLQPAAHAGPVEDRQALLDHYHALLPNVGFTDYVYGTFSMDAPAKRQYDDIMSFPPFSIDVDEGQALWGKPFKNGKTFASCFENGGKNIAGNYPYYDDNTRRVVTFENAVNACLGINGEKLLEYGGKQMGLITAYAKSLSDGMKVAVKVGGKGALSAYLEGRRYYYEKHGKDEESCASCHVDHAGKPINGEKVSMMVGQATHYPEFIGGTQLMTLQQRYRQCAKNIGGKPLNLNSETYNDLEYFMTYMSNGLPMQTPVFRK